MTIYLYVKTHKITGLKYLGKTSKNPFDYKGSGKYWLRHIKKHGYNVTTEILLATESMSEIKETGIFFSNLWNIVQSTEWANLMVETGTGGDNSQNINYVKLVETKKKNGKTWCQTEESNKKRSIAHRGKKLSQETIQKILEAKRKNGTLQKPWTKETHPESAEKCRLFHAGRKKSKEHIDSMRKRPQDTTNLTCPHCDKTGDYKNMKRWHMDRCKNNPERISDKDPQLVTCNKCGYTAKQSPNFYKHHNEHCKS